MSEDVDIFIFVFLLKLFLLVPIYSNWFFHIFSKRPGTAATDPPGPNLQRGQPLPQALCAVSEVPLQQRQAQPVLSRRLQGSEGKQLLEEFVALRPTWFGIGYIWLCMNFGFRCLGDFPYVFF